MNKNNEKENLGFQGFKHDHNEAIYGIVLFILMMIFMYALSNHI